MVIVGARGRRAGPGEGDALPPGGGGCDSSDIDTPKPLWHSPVQQVYVDDHMFALLRKKYRRGCNSRIHVYR